MDGERFDTLSRTIVSPRHRRSILKGMIGSSVGGAMAMLGFSRGSAQPAMVGICHFTGSKRRPYITMQVPEQFVSIYESRGDLVSCPGSGVLNTSTCECDCSLTVNDCPGGVNTETCTCRPIVCEAENDPCGAEVLNCSCAEDVVTHAVTCVDHDARGGSENGCNDHDDCPGDMICAGDDSCIGGYCYPLCGQVEEYMLHFGPYEHQA